MRLALLFGALALLAAGLGAQDIVLVDGRYLHVKIVEPNEKGIKVLLLDGTGGQVFISWGLIHEPIRKELRIKFGLDEDEAANVIVEEGNRVTTKIGEVWEGRVVNETADAITLKHQGSQMTIPKNVIKELEKVPTNVLNIYSPEEYYAKRAGELKAADDDIPGNEELAELANDLNLYEKSFLHFKKVQATDPGYKTEYIANILKRLEELQKHKQIRDILDDSRRQAMYKQFPKALAQLEAILGMKDIPASLKAEAEVIKQKTIKLRYEHYRLLVRSDYEGLVKAKIRAMSRDEKLKLDEARRKLRVDLHKEIVLELAAKHGIDPKEVEKMWEERGFNQPRTATYGSGSFIVLGRAPDYDKYEQEMNKYLQDVLRKQQSTRNDQGGSLSAQPERLPKPPTKEEWWQKISTSQDREGWMLAFWAENSKKVHVVGDRWEDCSRCGATGSLKFSGSQGDIVRAPCPNCQGHKRYKGVAFK
jgi:hypothetical protein